MSEITLAVRNAGLTTQIREGRFWKKGAVHAVANISLQEWGESRQVVTSAHTGCGEEVPFAMLKPRDASAVTCRRRGCK